MGKIQGVAISAAAANLVSGLNNATARTATATLLAGEETIFSGSTAAQTLTLPASPPASSINTLTNSATVSVTLAPGAGATLSNFGTSGNITIPAGYTFAVVYIGTTWYVQSAGPSDFAKNSALGIGNGGTGQATQQAAINALTGTQSSGQYLRSNGTNAALSAIQAADVPTLNQSTTGNAANVTGTVAITNGGTGQTAQAAAFNALSPMTASGDTVYGGTAGAGTRLAGNTTATKNFLVQTGNGTVSAAPAWGTIGAGDVPTLNQSTTGTAAGLSATLAIASGGTGQTTAQLAMNALAGAVTSGDFLRGNGTNVVMGTIQAADVPTLNQTTTGNAANVTGTVALGNGGTGQVTAAAAYNALSPMSATGDIEYESATNTASRLAGNTTTTKKFLTQTGNGTISAAPGWNTIAAVDVPTLNQSTTGTAAGLSATLAIASGGTNATTAAAALTSLGALPVAGGTMTGWLAPAVATLTDGTTVPVNAALGNDFRWTLTGNTHTLSNPTNSVDGQKIIVQVTQPASGGPYTIQYGTNYLFSAALPGPDPVDHRQPDTTFSASSTTPPSANGCSSHSLTGSNVLLSYRFRPPGLRLACAFPAKTTAPGGAWPPP